MKLSEAVAQLNELGIQLGKAKGEILTKIADLETQLADVEIPADAQATLESLKSQAQALDDIVPDQA